MFGLALELKNMCLKRFYNILKNPFSDYKLTEKYIPIHQMYQKNRNTLSQDSQEEQKEEIFSLSHT